MFSKINSSFFGSKKTQQDSMYIRQMKEVMNRWHSSSMDTARYGLRSVHSKHNLLVCQIALLLGLDQSKQSKYTRYPYLGNTGNNRLLGSAQFLKGGCCGFRVKKQSWELGLFNHLT